MCSDFYSGYYEYKSVRKNYTQSFWSVSKWSEGYICLENICYDDIDKEKVIFIHQIFENLKDTLLEIQMKYPKNLHVKIENNE